MKNKVPKIPNAIKKILLADEEVLAVEKQSRCKAAFTPDSIIVTNLRVIRCSPSRSGFHHEIEDYHYEDIANIKIDKGIFFGNIIIKRRFMSENLVLNNLPKGRVDNISRLIQENLRRLSSSQLSQVPTTQRIPISSPEDPLQVLRLRFAKGEITREQFEEMKKQLD